MSEPATNCETFALDFGNGARVTVRVDYSRIGSPAAAPCGGFFAIAYQGPLRRRDRKRCPDWFAETFAAVANRANRAIVLAFPADDGPPRALVCEPDAPPEWVSLP